LFADRLGLRPLMFDGVEVGRVGKEVFEEKGSYMVQIQCYLQTRLKLIYGITLFKIINIAHFLHKTQEMSRLFIYPKSLPTHKYLPINYPVLYQERCEYVHVRSIAVSQRRRPFHNTG
jgi:hypothetical protein